MNVIMIKLSRMKKEGRRSFLLFAMSFLCDLAMGQTVWDGTATPFTVENGQADIYTAEELAWLSESVKDGTDYEGIVINLRSNIVLNENVEEKVAAGNTAGLREWSPIGRGSINGAVAYPFKGTFDGHGHVVSGVYINQTESGLSNYEGLFGVQKSGTIRCVGVEDSYVRGRSRVAGLCAESEGTIEYCYNAGKVDGVDPSLHATYYHAGICGKSSGVIRYCYNTGDIVGQYSTYGVGYGDSETTNCYNIGSVQAAGGARFGCSGSGTMCFYGDWTTLPDAWNSSTDVAKTAEELKAGNLFGDNGAEWIYLENEYPLLWFLVKSNDGGDGYYYTTYYHSKVNLLVCDETAVVYKATGKTSDGLLLKKIPDNVIPKGNAVVIRSKYPDVMLVASDQGADFAENVLEGIDEPKPKAEVGDVYTLAKENGVIGFYKYKGTTLGGHKAYIPFTAFDSEEALSLPFYIEDDMAPSSPEDDQAEDGAVPTEIGRQEWIVSSTDNVFYTMQGVKIQRPTQKGVYIKNGKKVCIR